MGGFFGAISRKNTKYDVFYFKSVGKEFFSKGTPLHAGIRLNITL